MNQINFIIILPMGKHQIDKALAKNSASAKANDNQSINFIVILFMDEHQIDKALAKNCASAKANDNDLIYYSIFIQTKLSIEYFIAVP